MNAKDSASVLGRYDREGSLFVVYEAAGVTLRARLSPTDSREALTLVRLEQVEDEDYEEVVEEFDPTHVPPVVREAVQRPVQVEEENEKRGLGRTYAGP